MSVESRQIQTALTQILENYQRCGISRFGALAADELPAQWFDGIAESKNRPKLADTDSPDLAEPAQTARRVSEVQTTSEVPTTDRPSQSTSSSLPSNGALAPSATIGGVQVGGLAAEPWSLPVLDTDQRQQRFESLAQQVRDCRKCTAIVDHRQQTVFGDGPLHPTVCFMGEAPGADEDRTGMPFVGKAGQLLTKIITAMKLRREDVYILNALKCRPPQNRTPINEEIENCRHFVEVQLDSLQPKFIVCLGAVAVRSILQSELSIGRLRGKFYEYRGARVVVTYHPSYLLRNESAKRLVWDDMKMLIAQLPPAQT